MISPLPVVLLALAVAPSTTFDVHGRKFGGTNTRVCIIEGQWSDSEPFRYQAWDTCENMTMEWVPPQRTEQVVQQVHGRDKTFIVPAGSEGYRLANDQTTVWLFRDANGELQEITVSD